MPQPSWHEWAVTYKEATDLLALSRAQYIDRTQAAKKHWIFLQEVQLYAPGDPRRRRLGSGEQLPELRAFEQAVEALITLQTDRHMEDPLAITQPKVAPTRTPSQTKEIAKALTTLLNIRIETTLQVNPEATKPDTRTAAAWRRELGRGAKALGWFTGRYLYVLEQKKHSWLEWQSHKLFGTEITQTTDDISSPESITPNTTESGAKGALSHEATSPAADASSPSRQPRPTQQRTRRRP